MLCWGHNSLGGVSAASQQTLFIVSGSPSNPMLGAGEQNAELEALLGWTPSSLKRRQVTLRLVQGHPLKS